MPDTETVHLLRQGRALCGKSGLPGKWGPGHKWVHADSDDHGPRTAANCAACLDRGRAPIVTDPEAYLDLMNRLIELHQKGELGLAPGDVALVAYALPGPKAVFPDMSGRKAVTYGPRSGVIIVGLR